MRHRNRPEVRATAGRARQGGAEPALGDREAAPAHDAAVAANADGVLVGSAIVSAMERGEDVEALARHARRTGTPYAVSASSWVTTVAPRSRA